MSLDAADTALLEAVRTLNWPAREQAPAGLAGEHSARVLGGSAEFTEYRVYRQGDDPRRIDWKLLARSDRVFIRLSQDRTVLPTTLVVDASASLTYPSDTLEKWHYARMLATGIAAVARRTGDPVSIAVAADTGLRRLPPRTRQGTVHDIALLLRSIVPSGSASLAPLLARLRPQGRIVIITDFLGDADALLREAAQLRGAGREVHALHVVHADELNPQPRAALLFDPENPAVRRPLTVGTRDAYLDSFGTWCSELAKLWRDAGAVFFQVSTAEPVAHAVRRIVQSVGGGNVR